jgi:hypothetical protein
MSMAFWLFQAAEESGSGSTPTIRIVAGVLALVCIVLILVRRKRKGSKEDWS